MEKIKFSDRLSFRQAKDAFLIGILLGLITSSIQTSLSIVNEKKRVNTNIAQLVNMIKKSVSQSIYHFDRKQADETVKGLLEYKLIKSVALIDDYGDVLSSGTKFSKDKHPGGFSKFIFQKDAIYKFPLFFGRDRMEVGYLQLEIDRHEIEKDFISRTKMIIIGDLVRNIILACVLVLTFYYNLTLPLQKLALNLLRIDFSKPSKKPISIPSGHEKDEVGILVRIINKMVDNILKSTVSIEVLEREQQRFRDVAESSGDWIWEVDAYGCYTFSSYMVEKILGYKSEEVVGKHLHDFFCLENKDKLKKVTFEMSSRQDRFEGFVYETLKKDGSRVILESSGVPMFNNSGDFIGYRGVNRDITERRRSEIELKTAQARLMQSEKMAAVGQLSAGVAHEINNPMGFVISNLDYISDHIKVLFAEVERTLKNYPSINESDNNFLPAFKILDNFKTVSIDIIDALEESKIGANRVKEIVASLKDFAHPSKDDFVPVDINKEIDNALMLVWNELKYKCNVEKEYNDVPRVLGNSGQLSQVFVNLFINSVQAIKDKGKIVIKTYSKGDYVFIDFSDNGLGINKQDLNKVFEPFFTTKEIGKGTGLGLSIVYSIIQKHNGTINISSKELVGTNFIIKLPVFEESNES